MILHFRLFWLEEDQEVSFLLVCSPLKAAWDAYARGWADIIYHNVMKWF